MLIYMQGEIENYNLLKQDLAMQDDSDLCDVPTIKNFAVVPISNNKRKHIRIDTDAFQRILIDVDFDPNLKVKKKGKTQMPIDRFMCVKFKHWCSDFNMKKNQTICQLIISLSC